MMNESINNYILRKHVPTNNDDELIESGEEKVKRHK